MELNNEFIGRQKELAKLHEAYQNASSGNGQMVLVEGSAGIGKSGLVREFLKQIEKELCVIGTSECNDKENLNAYAPFKELLVELNTSSNTSKGGVDKLKGFLKEAGSSWVELIPVIGTYAKIGIETYEAYQKNYSNNTKSNIESENDVFRIFENEFRRLAQEKTIVVFIDDLQWADASSLNLMFGLGKAIRGNSFNILFIGSYRANEVKAGRIKVTEAGELVKLAHPFTDKLNMLRTYTKTENHVVSNPNWFHEISLNPFTKNEVEKLINVRFQNNNFGSDFFDQIFDVTDGHALFVVEILNYLVSEKMIAATANGFRVQKIELNKLPTSIDGVISEKVERLNANLQKVLAYASVNGEEFSFQIIEQILNMETEEQEDILEDHLEELSNTHGLLAEDVTTSVYDFSFTQSLVHKFVYAQMSNLKRKRLHRKIASILKNIYGDSLSNNQEMLDKYNLHKQIGLGLIDGVSLQMSFVNANASSTDKEEEEELNENVFIDAAAEELKKAENSYTLYAMTEALDFSDKALAFLTKVPDDNQDKQERKFEINFLRTKILHWQGHYKLALEKATEMLNIAQESSNEEHIALANINIAISETDLGNSLQALPYLEKAIETYKKNNNTEFLLKAYYQFGRTQHVASKFDEAIETFGKSLIMANKLDDTLMKAKVLRRIGKCYYSKSENDAAFKFYNEALEIVKKMKSGYHIGIVYNDLGNAFNSKGEFNRSLEFYEKSGEIAKSINDQIGISTSLSNIGMVHQDKGDYLKALEFYSKSLDIDKALDDKTMIIHSLMNIGSAHRELHDFTSAFKILNEALSIANPISDKSHIASVYFEFGNAHLTKGDYEDASKYYLKSLEINELLKNDSSIATNFQNIGTCYSYMNDNEKAREYYEKSGSFFEKVGDEMSSSLVLNNLATLEVDEKNYAKAISLLERSLKYKEKVNDKVGLSFYGSNLATCYRLAGEHIKAKQLLENCIQIAEGINEKVHLTNHYDRMGEVEFELENYKESISWYQKSLALNKELDGKNNMESNYYSIAFSYRKLKEYDSSIEYLKKSIELLDDDNVEVLAGRYSEMGEYYSAIENHFEAINYYKKAAQANGKLKNWAGKSANLSEIGDIQYGNKKYEESLVTYQESLNILLEKDPDNLALIAARYSDVGYCYNALEQYSKAVEVHLEAVKIQEELFGETDSVVAVSYIRIGIGYYWNDENMEAVNSFRKAYKIRLANETEETVFDTDEARYRLGNACFFAGLIKESEEVLTSCLNFRKRTLGVDNEDYKTVLKFMEDRNMGAENPVGNAAPMKDNGAVKKNVPVPTNTSEENIEAIFGQAIEQFDNGDFELALPSFQKSLAIITEHPESEDKISDMGLIHFHLGQTNKSLNQYDEAIPHYITSYNLYLKTAERNNEQLAKVCSYLGDTYYYKSDYKNAIENHKESLELYLEVEGVNGISVGWAYDDLGVDYYWNNEYDLSIMNLKRALKIIKKEYGKEHKLVAELYMRLGNSYLQTDNENMAVGKYEKARQIRETLFGANSEEVDDSMMQLGKAYFYVENEELANKYLYASLRFRRNYFGVESEEYKAVDNWIGEHLGQ